MSQATVNDDAGQAFDKFMRNPLVRKIGVDRASFVAGFETCAEQHAEDARRDLRDYFAGKALAGICGDGIPGSHHRPEETARSAYDYADAMLAERTGARR